MGRSYDAIDDALASFLLAQPVFFVASAPLGGDGLVNCSPKSNNGELAVLGPRKLAYLDRTGSGVETIAHLRENGRVVLMFCAFEGKPRIVRVHGRGSVVLRDDVGFDELAAAFSTDQHQGARSVVVVSAERVLGLVRLRGTAHELCRPQTFDGEVGCRQRRPRRPGVLASQQRPKP